MRASEFKIRQTESVSLVLIKMYLLRDTSHKRARRDSMELETGIKRKMKRGL